METQTTSWPASTRVSAPVALHRQLSSFNHERLQPRLPTFDQREAELQQRVAQRMGWLERSFVEQERASVHDQACAAPRSSAAFVAWFEALELAGPGQHDPLFIWLQEHATRDEMIWFLRQEVAGEAGFDDLVALTQVKLAPRAKLELARNYWDEMGCGHQSAMHGPMLQRLAQELAIEPDVRTTVWESLALSNLMLALADNRQYAYHAIGALGAIELTAPGRAACVNAGLKRLGVAGEARRYFALHATLDIKHSVAWNREVIGPLVEDNPDVAIAIAEGALMRLRAGERCFERYRRFLGVDVDAANASVDVA